MTLAAGDDFDLVNGLVENLNYFDDLDDDDLLYFLIRVDYGKFNIFTTGFLQKLYFSLLLVVSSGFI